MIIFGHAFHISSTESNPCTNLSHNQNVHSRLQHSLVKFKNIESHYSLSHVSRCHVVTRVRGERGGTTGVLDRGIGEKRERERRTHTRMDKEAHGDAARQHRRHELSRRESIRTQVYVYKYMYAENSNGYNRSGRRDGCRRLITRAHRGARWRFCRKHPGVPRSRISLLRTCTTESYGERQRRRARSQSDNTSFPLTRDTLFLALPLFYSPRREAVINSVLLDRDTL